MFDNNISPRAAGARINLHTGVSTSSINISNSLFRRNGGVQRVFNGGGLLMLFNLPVPDRFLQNVQLLPISIKIENTSFEENVALLAGGVGIFSLRSPLVTKANQNQVVFKSCKFLENISNFGSAFVFQSHVYSGFEPSVNIMFDDVSFENNKPLNLFSLKTTIGVLYSLNVTIRGKTHFEGNIGTALSLSESIITVDGYLEFINNSNGGIYMHGISSIVLRDGSAFIFKRNRAANQGGAITFEYPTLDPLSPTIDCFLWFEELSEVCRTYTLCRNAHKPNATIVFDDNQAPVGGTIYGSSLSYCPWAVYPNGTRPLSGITFLQQLPSVTFNPSPNDSSVVSTVAGLLFRNMHQPIYTMPGKEMHLNITALDYFGQSVSTTIRSSFLYATSRHSKSQLGSSGDWYLIPNRTVPITFSGEPGDTLVASVFSVDTNVQVEMTVILTNCSFGFILSGSERCLCDRDLPSLISCDQQSFELQVPSHKWLGNSPTGGFAYASCIFDYCKVGTKIISDGDIDSQCEPEYNRVGLLCASCKANMSVVFGSNACRPCSNAWLAFIIVYGVLGIVLVLAISFLGFSISEGYLNSLLFYCNVTSSYSSFFAPNGSIGFFLVKFINLSMGFEVCFYDGMDTLAKVGIQLLFPAYLFFIMLVIIILAKCSSKISNAGFSAAKTFSTLLLLCYTSVGETCILILAWKLINGLNGTYWYADPTIQYGEGFHGLLVFVAVVLILVYILPFSIGLLLPPLILRTRLSIMLKPLLDAFWNPFKPKFRFWIGLRALLRIVPFCFAVFTPYPTNCLLLIVFILVLLFLHMSCQPYEGKVQNLLDGFFYLNIIFLSAGVLYFSSIPLENIGDEEYIIFLSVVDILSYVAFLLIVLLHINIRFPVILKTARKLYPKRNHKLMDEKCVNDKDRTDIHQNVTFTELRESLLDGGDLLQ